MRVIPYVFDEKMTQDKRQRKLPPFPNELLLLGSILTTIDIYIDLCKKLRDCSSMHSGIRKHCCECWAQCTSVIPASGKMRWKDDEFEASV